MAIDIVVGAGQTNTAKYNFTADKTVHWRDCQGQNTIYAIGSFGGGTVTFYAMPDFDDANKIALGLTMTTAGFLSIPAHLGPIKTAGILAVMSGSTGPNLNLWII